MEIKNLYKIDTAIVKEYYYTVANNNLNNLGFLFKFFNIHLTSTLKK